ncbi:isoleucine--tRNA ligase, cytoplasmic-like [Paramacrobiotus metropolitanus]|uniref:isoleucine--tRNA ligase, cytoplasmic-like n=1 Tax=Paramacrobiotus metropolitanus TaxID=2943436 RepID=UPI0024457A26|nr:isoleucine--tRNA ligase, cytoplasmic-like [Paramacrobiotus metropolitanus]
MAASVPENISFPQEEEKILELWKQLNAFETSLKLSEGKKRFTFYDGPPFATGLPHYGHILAGTIKDIVTRFAHQSGFHVERRFGWDCHGLPVEYEIDKTMGIKGPADVEKMGIEAYNNECRKIVMRYASDWETIVTRLGRWIDFRNDYKTLYPWFMESVWWVFKQLYDKGLVYQGCKVMPFSTGCNTPLSNFESGQNYKDVTDPAVIVSFPLIDDPTVAFIAWTTTPWTLPSNLALCVNPSKTYVKIQDNSSKKVYIMMEARIPALFKKAAEYTILEKFTGETLKGLKYLPLFKYFVDRQDVKGFVVLADDYVTEESGTGVVHQAPYFGEDDYRVCVAHNVITRDTPMVCPVDATGTFTDEVTDFKGQYVKDADKAIIKWLKENGRLVHASQSTHSYPFCWRSDTPLIYKAVPSWFVRVEEHAQALLANNEQTYWVPAFVKEKRFANWLRDARDWAISRNRYWGTPIPLWISEDGQEIVCIGSIEELAKLSGVTVNDLHRDTVDKITIPSSRAGGGVLKRVSEVFDCWFESGSMPYAQVHYPFENRGQFEESFPADFIAEGVDQTRGWFYTLLVLSTLLFEKPPFKNLIANGLVLAADGQKMSKSKKNYPNPVDVVHKYGADALRLYLINSPVVRAENLRFKEEGVRDILKDVFLPWYNAYRFFTQQKELYEKDNGKKFVFDERQRLLSDNIMDRWILSFTQSLVQYVMDEMQAYRLYTVVPRLVKFVDLLTNWYVRSNRKRLKGEDGPQDTQKALETLFDVLFTMVRMMAPFTPFLTELMYQNLKGLVKSEKDVNATENQSVHFLMLPEVKKDVIHTEIERAVSRMQAVVDLGRQARERRTLPIKSPLSEVIVIHQDPAFLEDVRALESYVTEELNVRTLTTTTDKKQYHVQLRAEPDHKTLGAKLKGTYKAVIEAVKNLSDEELCGYQEKGFIDISGTRLEGTDLKLIYMFGGQAAGDAAKNYEASSDNEMLVLLNVNQSQELLDEGTAREVVNRIQKLRKKAGLVPTDDIHVYYEITPAESELNGVMKTYTDYIGNAIKKPLFHFPAPEGEEPLVGESQSLKGTTEALLHLSLFGGPDYKGDAKNPLKKLADEFS